MESVPLKAELSVDTFASKTRPRSLGYHLHTLLLLTYSDIKAVIIPQSLFAISCFFSPHGLILAASSHDPSQLSSIPLRLLHMLLWLWLHLVILDLSNQRLPDSIAEDGFNKPWRPLPSRRLSASEARTLLFLAVPAALALSFFGTGHTAYTPSVTLCVLSWLYNDLEGSSVSVLARNALNAAGLTCFGWGALAVLAGPGAEMVWPRAGIWMGVSAAIILTTIHVQDFRDEEGDRQRGRRTVALMYSPAVARGACAVLVLLWAVLAPAFWCFWNKDCESPCWWSWSVSLGLALAVGGLLMATKGQKMDELALTMWCVWVGWVYLLPVSMH